MTAPSRKQVIASWVVTALVALFLAFDVTIHLLKPAPVIEAFTQLQLPIAMAVPVAIIELTCLVLFLLPRTTILGAILLTGYLGGAVLTNWRVGMPLGSTVLFPVYTGVLLWLGIWLRNEKLRALIPLQS